jgi:hypothetical protein
MSVRKFKNNRAMSYDEVSLRLWESEGKKGKPLSREGIRRIEVRALQKVKASLAESGFTEEDVAEYFANLGSVVEMSMGE